MTATLEERSDASFVTNPHQDRERLVQVARDLVSRLVVRNQQPDLGLEEVGWVGAGRAGPVGPSSLPRD